MDALVAAWLRARKGKASQMSCSAMPRSRASCRTPATVELAAAVRFQEPAGRGLRRAAVSIRVWLGRERPFAGDPRLSPSDKVDRFMEKKLVAPRRRWRPRRFKLLT